MWHMSLEKKQFHHFQQQKLKMQTLQDWNKRITYTARTSHIQIYRWNPELHWKITCIWTVFNICNCHIHIRGAHFQSFVHSFLFILKFLLPHPNFCLYNTLLFLNNYENARELDSLWKYFWKCIPKPNNHVR